MLFEESRPFIRYARELSLGENSSYGMSVPYDARFFYVRAGEGEIFTGGRTYSMTAGSVLLLPAGTPYHLLTPRHGVTYFALNFDFTWERREHAVPIPPVPVEEFRERDCLCRVDFEDAPVFSAPLYLSNMFLLEPSLSSIENEYLKKMIYYEVRMSAVFFKVLTDCLRSTLLSGAAEGRAVGAEILDYLHRHYREPLTNESIGARFGFHKNYVSELVKTLTGRPLHQYLLYIRLNHAWELLEGGGRSIGEIAHDCGFEDLCYFSRYFKQVFGHAPSYYLGT